MLERCSQTGFLRRSNKQADDVVTFQKLDMNLEKKKKEAREERDN
jgi:hypothetical protein